MTKTSSRKNSTPISDSATLVQAYLALIRNTGHLRDEGRVPIVNLVSYRTASLFHGL